MKTVAGQHKNLYVKSNSPLDDIDGNSRKTLISLSGGKDSTAMLLMMLERGEQIDHVYFFDTEWEWPEVYANIALLESNTGIHIDRIRSYRPFDDLVRVWGLPKSAGGWCTAKKRDVSMVYERAVGATEICIGFAADEIDRSQRPTIGHRRSKRNVTVRYPLIEYGITEQHALEYCYSKGYRWNGLYEKLPHLGCIWCPKGGKTQLKFLQNNFPEHFARYLELQKISDSRKGTPSNDLGLKI